MIDSTSQRAMVSCFQMVWVSILCKQPFWRGLCRQLARPRSPLCQEYKGFHYVRAICYLWDENTKTLFFFLLRLWNSSKLSDLKFCLKISCKQNKLNIYSQVESGYQQKTFLPHFKIMCNLCPQSLELWSTQALWQCHWRSLSLLFHESTPAKSRTLHP